MATAVVCFGWLPAIGARLLRASMAASIRSRSDSSCFTISVRSVMGGMLSSVSCLASTTLKSERLRTVLSQVAGYVEIDGVGLKGLRKELV